jgi:hypothetical protein
VATQQIETLRQRVQALGYKLILDLSHDEENMAILDPRIGKLVIVRGNAEELDTWLVDRETGAADAKKIEAQADDDRLNEISVRLEGIRATLRTLQVEHTGGDIGAVLPLLERDVDAVFGFLALGKPQISAVALLKQLEEKSEAVPLEDVLKYLSACNFDVMQVGAINENSSRQDEWTVSHNWTEKGVRYQWAEQKLISSLRLPSRASALATLPEIRRKERDNSKSVR